MKVSLFFVVPWKSLQNLETWLSFFEPFNSGSGLTSFHANVPPKTLKNLENLWFTKVFRVYKNGALA